MDRSPPPPATVKRVRGGLSLTLVLLLIATPVLAQPATIPGDPALGAARAASPLNRRALELVGLLEDRTGRSDLEFLDANAALYADARRSAGASEAEIRDELGGFLDAEGCNARVAGTLSPGIVTYFERARLGDEAYRGLFRGLHLREACDFWAARQREIDSGVVTIYHFMGELDVELAQRSSVHVLLERLVTGLLLLLASDAIKEVIEAGTDRLYEQDLDTPREERQAATSYGDGVVGQQTTRTWQDGSSERENRFQYPDGTSLVTTMREERDGTSITTAAWTSPDGSSETVTSLRSSDGTLATSSVKNDADGTTTITLQVIEADGTVSQHERVTVLPNGIVVSEPLDGDTLVQQCFDTESVCYREAARKFAEYQELVRRGLADCGLLAETAPPDARQLEDDLVTCDMDAVVFGIRKATGESLFACDELCRDRVARERAAREEEEQRQKVRRCVEGERALYAMGYDTVEQMPLFFQHTAECNPDALKFWVQDTKELITGLLDELGIEGDPSATPSALPDLLSRLIPYRVPGAVPAGGGQPGSRGD